MNPDIMSELMYEIFIAIREAHNNFMAQEDTKENITADNIAECIVYASMSAIKVLVKKDKKRDDKYEEYKRLIIDYANNILTTKEKDKPT